MDMESDMGDGDMDMLDWGKTSNHDPSSSRAGFTPKGQPRSGEVRMQPPERFRMAEKRRDRR